MKRFIIGIFIFLISLFSFSAPAMAEGASLSISGGGAKKIGDTFNLTASLNTGGNQICIVTFDITYPADLLTLKSLSLGSPFTMIVEQSSSDGNIHYMVGAGGCTTGNATLLTMSFTAKAAGSATVAFSSGEALGGVNGQQVIATGKGSTAVTIGTTTTGTPATTESNENTDTAPPATPKSSENTDPAPASGKDQIAIDTESPETTVVAEPASNTKPKTILSNIVMIGGGVIVALVVVLLIIFIYKRRQYLKATKENSGL